MEFIAAKRHIINKYPIFAHNRFVRFGRRWKYIYCTYTKREEKNCHLASSSNREDRELKGTETLTLLFINILWIENKTITIWCVNGTCFCGFSKSFKFTGILKKNVSCIIFIFAFRILILIYFIILLNMICYMYVTYVCHVCSSIPKNI